MHRFAVSPAGATAAEPIRVAYADPPYPGLAHKYYSSVEVNHAILVGTLCRDFPAGWALSTSAAALASVLELCPAGTRVCAWVKGSRRGRAYRARNAWEPLLVYRGRPVELGPRDELSDALVWGGRQHSHPGALIGMKPARFCEWMFRQLGLRAGDELVDVFPGSGAVGHAWQLYASSLQDCDASRTAAGDGWQAVAASSPRRLCRSTSDATRRVQADATHASHVDDLDGSEVLSGRPMVVASGPKSSETPTRGLRKRGILSFRRTSSRDGCEVD